LASAIADELLRFAERLGAARVIAFLVGGSGPIERRIGLHHLVGLRLAAARLLRAPLRDLRRRRLPCCCERTSCAEVARPCEAVFIATVASVLGASPARGV